MKSISIHIQHAIFLLITTLFLGVIGACEQAGKTEEGEGTTTSSIEAYDLAEILKAGKLRILAENSSASYFIYRGRKMGFEYEVLRDFCREIGVEMEIITVNNLDDIEGMLNKKQGDLIACNYTVTNERKKDIAFSIPYLRTKQVLVQRKPEGWEKMSYTDMKKKLLNEPSQLAHKKVNVWENSSYYRRLMNLQDEIGDSIYIVKESGDYNIDDLIEKVANGDIDYTVVEKNVARVNSKFYDNIDASLEISFNQKIAFGLRKSSPVLKARLDEWLKKYMQGRAFKFIKHKYFELTNITSNSLDKYSSVGGGHISKYDDLFKKEAEKYNWDWRILAALAYQETKFNPNAVSFGGAYSMMQFMPGVGPKYGVYPNSPVEVQVRGGMKKLYRDYENWPEIKDHQQRQKFALASYNAGLGHIKDAQRLAEKHGLNPLIWDENVSEMVKKLSQREFYRDPVVRNGAMRGVHTANYVQSIFRRFESYKSMFKK